MPLISETKHDDALVSESDAIAKAKDATNRRIDMNARLRQRGLSNDKLALLQLKENVLDEIKRLQEARTVAENNAKDLRKQFNECKSAEVVAKRQKKWLDTCYVESQREYSP